MFSPPGLSIKTQSTYFYLDIKHFPESFYTQHSQKTKPLKETGVKEADYNGCDNWYITINYMWLSLPSIKR